MRRSRSPKPLPRSVKGESRTAESLKQTLKGDPLVGRVQRLLLANALKDDRPSNVVHPSELCKPDWCSRRAFYRITGVQPTNPEPISARSHQIFSEGNAIHDKWQGWLWDLGLLKGMFFCHQCKNVWWDQSPEACPKCEQERWGLRYREVPVRDEEMMLGGFADGQIPSFEFPDDEDEDELVEIKSVGPGTVRYERPELFFQYDKGEITLEGMWKSIKRPFVSHSKQAMFYAKVVGLKRVRFIYEWKPYQATKVFIVTLNEAYIEDMIEAALDTAWAVRNHRTPRRPSAAEPDPKKGLCGGCIFYDHCWSNHGEETTRTVRIIRR